VALPQLRGGQLGGDDGEREARVKRSAIGAVGAQGAQALASFTLQVLVARTLGLDGLGTFAIIYGVMVLVAAIATGFVGDSLVVLPRREPPVRSALQQFSLGFAVLGGVAAGLVAAASGLVLWSQAWVVAVAVALFCLEELMRRLLMANVAFWRVAAIDLVAFAGSLAVIGAVAALGTLTLESFLLAISAGQVAAIGLGIMLLPRSDRFVVGMMRGGHRAVTGYGSWRASQQLLRPALLTAVRTIVTIMLGLTATGLLEAARVFVAPAMLVVSGLTSFLFVRYAQDPGAKLSIQLPRADRTVGALLLITVLLGGILVAALPLFGELLFGTAPPLAAVLGWLAYTASVSAVTPYGALAAVRGRQALVFAIRAGDTILSVAGVAALFLLDGPLEAVPLVLAAGSILGGLAIRAIILAPQARRDGRAS
jgi:O-antigen/teichoic acid export membrane protein